MRKGFTLIELLVAMVILGILSVIGLGSFQSSQMKARDAKRKAELGQISKALEVYFNDKGRYPIGVNGLIYGCGELAEEQCTPGEAWQDNNDTIYMVEMPRDPKAPGQVFYYISGEGLEYQLYARLENNLDIDVHKDAENNPQVFSGLSCGNDECNYGIASTNTSALQGRTLVAE
jgi:prepilin-type N-terminal cleavage/methylation domain-containing protein